MTFTLLEPVASPPAIQPLLMTVSPPFSPAEWVNTLQGTDSHLAFSTGNTLPLTTRPHGMVGWIPQSDEGRWPFDLRSPTIQGFRATHQPSPWNGDYGNILILVGSGARPPITVIDGESPYARGETIAHPHYYRTRLARHDVVVEIAPTQRGAHFRLTFGDPAHAWIAFRPAAGAILGTNREQRHVEGISTAVGPGVPGFNGCYFAAQLQVPVVDLGVVATPGAPPAENRSSQTVWLRLAPAADGTVTFKVATSFISIEQARLNLEQELGGRSFSDTRVEAQAEWDRHLSVVTIEGASDEQRRTFYGCLYRSLLYPRIWHERGPGGTLQHRSPFDERIHPGPLYTDCGFWDIHRTLTPLLSLIAPQLLGEMIEGWLNTFREGGWLPSWASPSYVPCMVGSHAGAVITDAYRKGIRSFDAATAYAAVRHDATCDPASFSYGRAGLNLYQELGWVPSDQVDHAVARTCDYALADHALSVLAGELGHVEDQEQFARRALSYRHLYDPESGFLRGRQADGSWREPFSAVEWSADYIEGSAWQHTWSAPHDAAGLIALMGGDEAFVRKLDELLRHPPTYEIGRYDRTIHEMTEMALAGFGQYAHSNEPVHHVLHLYTAAGRPDRAQYWVRRVLNELYGPMSFPGDEDNGAMGSWFVLNALGLYPLTPGHPAWVLGTPLFERAVVRLAGERTLTIRAVGLAPDAPYVREVHWNGRAHFHLEIAHADLAAGGELVFTMTADPEQARERGRLPRPYSLSTT